MLSIRLLQALQNPIDLVLRLLLSVFSLLIGLLDPCKNSFQLLVGLLDLSKNILHLLVGLLYPFNEFFHLLLKQVGLLWLNHIIPCSKVGLIAGRGRHLLQFILLWAYDKGLAVIACSSDPQRSHIPCRR
jgi:hypothetical protein